MSSIIKDVRAKLYTWKGPIQKIHDNFCTSAADILNKEDAQNIRLIPFFVSVWFLIFSLPFLIKAKKYFSLKRIRI